MTKILIDRSTVEQALEALERGMFHRELIPLREKAITALKAALAEPVQEPVAKVELMLTGGNAGLATRIVEIDDHLRERLRPGQLLYTAPPQRKPLTDEEIHDCWQQRHRDKTTERRLITRAIEQAHGIKE